MAALSPRLRVADTSRLSELARRLSQAGHHVGEATSWEDLAKFDLIIISEPAEYVPEAVQRLEPLVSSRQIVIHTAVELGAEPLIDLPALGIAMACFGDDFIVDTCDEISQAVAEVLVAEMHGSVWAVSDEERPDLARALKIAAEANALKLQALRSVSSEAARNIVIRQLGGW
ncbi:hypothetical protein J5O04_12180 [Corynebacterium hindlerae]|uniref:hypothetical protein n=1 Tax=Corynebacterium hindlerae TaxID=699041 RepID=UPI001AD67FB0|nr:hypothetical protein [Corynebacterium hindlerae]QTH59518.1 hypothetical protein J5O04_12180 [Corynebacterium hindlerae]